MTVDETLVMDSRGQHPAKADLSDAAVLYAAAKQHLRAANALGAHDGVILPQLLTATLSMSLYLKALAVHSGVMVMEQVKMQPESLLHALKILPEPLRSKLASDFTDYFDGGELEETLNKFGKAVALVCLQHQMPIFYEGFDLHEFMQLARFFGEQELPPA